MFWFILAVILAIVAVGMVIGATVTKTFSALFAIIPALLAVILLGLSGLKTVDTGNEGVQVTFGKVGSNLNPGVHWLPPWSDIKQLPTRTTPYTMDSHPAEGSKAGDDSIAATTLGGVQVKVDSTILYHINPQNATGVYKNIGLNYTEIIRSTSRTDIRAVFGAYDPVDASTVKVSEISTKVEAALVKDLGARGIVVEQFQLRQVELPDALKTAVQSKLAAQQSAEQATYALQQAQVEAQTQVAKAKGDADANALRTKTLTPAVLCEDFINALSQKMPGTLLTAGPCAGASTAGNNVLLNVPATPAG